MRRGDTHALTFFVVSHEYFNEDEGSILAFFVAIFLRIIAFLSSAHYFFLSNFANSQEKCIHRMTMESTSK